MKIMKIIDEIETPKKTTTTTKTKTEKNKGGRTYSERVGAKLFFVHLS